jgi:hypothetical protein
VSKASAVSAVGNLLLPKKKKIIKKIQHDSKRAARLTYNNTLHSGAGWNMLVNVLYVKHGVYDSDSTWA